MSPVASACVGRVSSEWFSRTDDERSLSLLELARTLPGADTPIEPTHWSFGQLASLIGASAAYLRQLPAALAGISNERIDGRATLQCKEVLPCNERKNSNKEADLRAVGFRRLPRPRSIPLRSSRPNHGRACSRTPASAAAPRLRSALSTVLPRALPAFAFGNGVCFTFFPAAFFARQPRGGLGMSCFLQIL